MAIATRHTDHRSMVGPRFSDNQDVTRCSREGAWHRRPACAVDHRSAQSAAGDARRGRYPARMPAIACGCESVLAANHLDLRHD